jgi:hypothetical protein
MAIGDIDEAVSGCVEAALAARGYPSPYKQSGTMNGDYNYQLETIIAFHRRVKGCLASKKYAYGYPESTEYLNQTLGMTLDQVEAAISARTGTAHFSADLASAALPAPAAMPTRGARKAAKKQPKVKS